MKTFTKIQALVSIPVVIIAAYFIISNILFIKKCDFVHAEITNSVFEKTTGNDGKYILSIKTIPSGKTIAGLVLDGDVNDTRYLKGKTIELYYYAPDPQKSEIKNVFSQWGIAMLLCFLLLYDLVSLWVLYVIYFRKEKTKKAA